MEGKEKYRGNWRTAIWTGYVNGSTTGIGLQIVIGKQEYTATGMPLLNYCKKLPIRMLIRSKASKNTKQEIKD